MAFKIKILPIIFIIIAIICACIAHYCTADTNGDTEGEKKIKWMDFAVSYNALCDAMQEDIKSEAADYPIDMTNIIAYLACKYGNNFSSYSSKDINEFTEKINEGKTIEEITANYKHFNYYKETYSAVLSQFVGNYEITVTDETGKKRTAEKYGLKAFSPISAGRGYSHYDDFGASRSYGFKRKHLGNDLLGGIGTPVIAVESGTVEALGWNRYGGWRIGIRSFDKKRYYYYAHLMKDHPYAKGLREGDTVNAGSVIGYLGMTGYSDKENVNNINVPHLHFGMQIIFDESQKDGNNEIWIDVYNIVKFLGQNRSEVIYNETEKEYYKKYPVKDVENQK